MKKKLNRIVLILVILVAAFALLPAIGLTSNYVIGVITTCFIFSALGMSWNVVAGYGGQISWCHAAFVSIGAYTSIIIFNRFAISPFLTIWLGIVISFLFATLIGAATMRFQGPVFSITTIAFAELLRVILLNLSKLTGGAAGLSLRFNKKSVGLFNLMFADNIPYYYIALVLLIIVGIIVYKFVKSRTGWYLNAIKGDLTAARSLGINVNSVKLRSFQISAMLASAIGAFYGFYMSFVDPYTTCGMDLSIKIGAVVILGGMGTIFGPVIGSFILIVLIELSSNLLGASGGTQVLYGLALMLIILIRPSGVITLFDDVGKKLFSIEKQKKEGV